LIKDEKGGVFADSQNILNRRKNFFSELLNAYGVNDVRQMEVHTAELLVSESCPSDFETGTEKLKRHKLIGIDEVAAELIQAGQNMRSDIHKLIHSISKKRTVS
jgi:hypothetical protein